MDVIILTSTRNGVFNVAIKEYTVKTSEKEKVERILSEFSEVKIIGEEKEQSAEKDRALLEEKKDRYRKLAGKALELGESIEELKRLSNREEPWRGEED